MTEGYRTNEPGASVNGSERNGHEPSLREYVAQHTDVEQVPGKPWWWANCLIPGCGDESQSFTVYENSGDTPDWFVCSSCNAEGDIGALEYLMTGHRRDPSPLGDHYPLAKAITEGVEPPEELEAGVLLKGKVHSINAAAGEGKTWLALWLVKRCIDRGQRVVYFDSENGPRIVAERLGDLGVDTKRIDDLLRYYPFPSLTAEPDTVAEYHAELDRFGPDLLIFDSQANFLGASGLEESSNDDLIKWATNFSRPARAREIAVVILDHTGHNGDHARGASRKRDEADVIWRAKTTAPFDRDTVGRLVLTREKDREAWLPERVGFSVGGTEAGFVFRTSDGTIEEPDPEDGLTATEHRALDVLRDEFGEQGATAAEWKRAASKMPYKVSEPSFYRALRTIKKLGLVAHEGSGRNSRYYSKPGPDDGGSGGESRYHDRYHRGLPRDSDFAPENGANDSEAPESRDSDFSRSDSEETPSLSSLSSHYHDSDDSESEPPNYHRYHHPFRGDSDDSVAEANPRLTEVGILDALKDVRGGPWRAMQNYREKPSSRRFDYLVNALLVYYGHDTCLSAADWSREAAAVRDALAPVLGAHLGVGGER